MKSILVASDLSQRSVHAVQRAFRLAHELDLQLTVMSVIDSDLPVEMAEDIRISAEKKLTKQAAEIATSMPCRYTVQVQLGDPSQDILGLSRETGAELIVLGLHRPRAVLDRYRETTMERIVRSSRMPVLLVANASTAPYGSVLAAVDFSPASAAAISVAHSIAPKAKITSFNAIHIPFKGFTGSDPESAETQSYMTEAKAECGVWLTVSDLPSGLAMPEIIEGAVHQVLDQQLAKVRPDLMAVGAHARAGAAPWLLGSFANDLMREPPCDLLITRPKSG